MIRKACAFLTTPTVPHYEGGIETRPISAPRAQAPGADAFGSAIGEGLSSVGKLGMQLVSDERAKADRTAVISSRTALDQTEVDLLYHPEKGALAKRGKDAFGIPEPTLKAFDEKTAEIEKGLATDEQKQAFRLVAQDRRVEIDKQLQRHVFGEMKTYSDEANKSALESTLNNVATNYRDPERVDKELKFGQALIMSDTDMKGKPPEFIKFRLDAWRSKVHEAVLDKLMIDDPIKAQTYFDQIQGKNPDFERPRGLVEKGNIDLFNRPKVKNADGSTSTVRSMGVNIDGAEVLIPTVSDDGRIMSDREAVQQYRETGRHLGKFKTAEDSDRYAQALHSQQEAYYLNGGSGGLLPSEAAKIERTLKPLVTKQTGMNTALELAPLLGAKPLTEVLGEVRTRLKDNPDALNLAETQLKQMESERRDQIHQAQEAAAAPVFKRIAEIQGAGRAAKLSDIPSADWAALVKVDPKTAGTIQDAIRRELQGEEDRKERKADRAERQADREEREQERAERKADRGTAAQLMNWAALNADPVSLANANLDKMLVTKTINRDHYKDLTRKQAELKNDPEKGTAIRSEAQTVEDVLAAGKVKKGSEDHSLAWQYVEDRKKNYVRESGKQPTRKEIEGFAREALYSVDVEGSIFDRPAYKVSFEDIPRKERAKIVDAFNRRGRAYTQADVIQAYSIAQARKGAK